MYTHICEGRTGVGDARDPHRVPGVLGTLCYGGGHTTTAFRERAALYLRSVCLGIGRLYFLTRNDKEWAASSLAMLGNPLGAQRKRRRVMPGVKKELVETTHSLRGCGMAKVSNVALGYEVAQKGGM